MKERPILFSAPMVRAILDGRKTMTRRVVKEPRVATLHGRRSLPEKHYPDPGLGYGGYLHWAYGGGDFANDVVYERVRFSVGVGDRLWVRETFAAPYGKEDGTVYYRADGPDRHDDGTWRPSIFMPRWASRIDLEITGVRVERLRDMPEADVEREGVGIRSPAFPRQDFAELWDSINGKRPGCLWMDSPWVWVVSFKRVEAQKAAAE